MKSNTYTDEARFTVQVGLEVIGVDHQHELVRNADLARHFQAGADRRQIAHAAVDAGGAVEANAPRFQRAVAQHFAFLVHQHPPSLSAPASPPGAALPMLGQTTEQRIEDMRDPLADGETDRLNTDVRVRNW